MAATAMFHLGKYTPISDEKIFADANSYKAQITKKRINKAHIPLNELDWEEQRTFLGNDDFLESWTFFGEGIEEWFIFGCGHTLAEKTWERITSLIRTCDYNTKRSFAWIGGYQCNAWI